MSSHESYQPTHATPDEVDEADDFGRHRAPRHSEGTADTTSEPEPRHLNDEYQPRHSTEVADTMTPEEREALIEDERNRHTDRELLGGSRGVAAAITEHGAKAMQGVLRAEAAIINTIGSPRRGYRNFLVSRAEKKVAKRERRLARAHDGVYKEHLQASLDKAQQKLTKHAAKRDKVAGIATSRAEYAKNFGNSERQRFVNHLMEKKGAAVLRKETRHRLREQGAGRLKSRSLAKQIIGSENAKHAIDLALVSRASSRGYKADMALSRYHKTEYESSLKKIQTAESRYTEASYNLNRTNHEISELEAVLPQARDKYEEVSEELQGIDSNDVRRIDVEARYVAAGKAFHRYEAELRNKKVEAEGYRHQMDKNLARVAKHTQASRVHGEKRRVANGSELKSRERYSRVSDIAHVALDELMNPVREPETTPDTPSENEPKNTEE